MQSVFIPAGNELSIRILQILSDCREDQTPRCLQRGI